MRTITKFRRSTRGLSPIFATLILIAIAVIAGIVVYMFTSGMLASLTGSGTTGQEKVAIQAVQVQANGVDVICQSTGGDNVPLGTTAIIKTAGGAVFDAAATSEAGPILTTLTTITVTPSIELSPGTYTVTLISVAGNPFVSSSFTVTVPIPAGTT